MIPCPIVTEKTPTPPSLEMLALTRPIVPSKSPSVKNGGEFGGQIGA